MTLSWHDTTALDHIPSPEEVAASPKIDTTGRPPYDDKEAQALYVLLERGRS